MKRVVWALALCLLSACGGADSDGPNGFSVGGSVSNLAGGQLSLVNSNNSNTPVVATSNGSFSFSALVPSGGSYNVTVNAQPAGQVCTVLNGSGSNISANVTNIKVICSSIATAVSVGGAVTGLPSGVSIQLLNNADTPNALIVNGSGSTQTRFSFPQKIAAGSNYAVSMVAQPAGLLCSLSNGQGVAVSNNVSSVAITCASSSGSTITAGGSGASGAGGTSPPGGGNGTTTFNVGGSVSGLATGANLVLTNNGDTSHSLLVTANGGFTLGTPVAMGGNYLVTVARQPAGQTCTANNNIGGSISSNISTVSISCANAVSTFTVGGTVSGLSSGRTLTLQNNYDAASAVTVTSNGSFSFATPVASGSTYLVAASSQPAGQNCAAQMGSGTVTGNITNIAVVCTGTGGNSFAAPINYNPATATVSTLADSTSLGATSMQQITTDGGNLYFVSRGQFGVYKQAIGGGSPVLFAGNTTTQGICTAADDGVGTAARFSNTGNLLLGVTTDGVNLYVYERCLANSGTGAIAGGRIRQINLATAVVTTLNAASDNPSVGGVGWSIATDGAYVYSLSTTPYPPAPATATGNQIVIAKTSIADGTVTTTLVHDVGGNPLLLSTTSNLRGIATNGTSVWINSQTGVVFQVDMATGVQTTFANLGGGYGLTSDGVNVYASSAGGCSCNGQLWQINMATGTKTLMAGTGTTPVGGVVTDGPALSATFTSALSITTDGLDFYISDRQLIRKLTFQ